VRTVDLPCFNATLLVYNSNERSAYEKDTDVELVDHRGYTTDNYVFCGGEIAVCFHEAVHFIDWLLGTHLCLEQGTLWGNTELRAYLVEYIGGEIMKYCVKEEDDR
jgi:hypothetical protein